MSQSAFIKLKEGSAVSSLTLDELKERLLQYKEQLARTGQQLDWTYAEKAFPYTIETKPEGEGRWFYLKGTEPMYRYIMFGVNPESEEDSGAIQVVLPEGATHGDKSKANELCKQLGKSLKAELHLFNGRVMYFNPRK